MKKTLFVILFLCTVLTLAVSLSPAPAFATDNSLKNWRVYNVKPNTSSFWDINKAWATDSAIATFPFQPYVDPDGGEKSASFAVYLLNNYNFDMTDKKLSAEMMWTAGEYKSRSKVYPGAYVRFEFQDVTAGSYNSNDYWWSTGENSLDLNGGTSGDLAVSLADRSKWTNLCGKSANDQTSYAGPNCVGGTDPAVTPFDGFTNAVKNVKQVGLAFGNSNRYASGVARDGGTGEFNLTDFTIQ